jgi:two-component system NtrC family sensor kinase
MRTVTLILFFFLIGRIGFGQNRQVSDSLRHELAITKQDTSRVLILVALAGNYQNVNPDSALRYGQQALNLAKKITFLRGQVRAFNTLGNANRLIGNLPKGLDLIFKGLQIAEENNFTYEAARCYNLLGVIFAANLGDNLKGSDYLRRALAMIKTVPNSKEKWSLEEQILRNLGSDNLERNNVDSSAYYFLKASKIQREANIELTPIHINNLGRIEFLRGNTQKAMEYSHQAIQLCKNTNNHRSASTVYNTLATYFKNLNQPDSAIYYSKIGLAEAQSIAYKDGILLNSRLLTELYESKDIGQAYEYQKIASITNEEINGLKKIQSQQKTITDELLRQRELEAERVAYQNRLRQYALLAGLGILLLIGFLLYRNNQQKQKANFQLNEQKQKVEQTLITLQSTQAQLIQKEKLASLGELTAGIAHEIQNPLNFVNNFSELSVELAQELKEEVEKPEIDRELISDLVSDLTQNQEKINLHGKRASSIVKGMLEHSRTGTGERQLTDINQLSDEYLRLSYHGLRAKNNDFNSDYELITDEHLPQIEVVPQEIGRVLLNLINNAFYAVNERAKQAETDYQPKVTVLINALPQRVGPSHGGLGGVEIQVQDNGNGIPESIKLKIFQPFFTTKPTGEGTGLGLSLAYDIITKGHGGTMEVETREGEGTTFIITLPMTN